MRIQRLILLLSCAIAMLALGAGPAAATTTTVRVDPSNASLGAGSIVTWGSTTYPATLLVATTGNVRCTKAGMSVTLGSKDVPYQTATLTSFTLENCTDTLPFIDFASCSLAMPFAPTVHLQANGSTGGSVSTTPTIKCTLTGPSGVGCYYHFTSMPGTFTNSDGTLSYSGANFSYGSIFGPSDGVVEAECGSSGTFSAKLTPATATQDGRNTKVTLTTV
jgi:hypothetical protein